MARVLPSGEDTDIQPAASRYASKSILGAAHTTVKPDPPCGDATLHRRVQIHFRFILPSSRSCESSPSVHRGSFELEPDEFCRDAKSDIWLHVAPSHGFELKTSNQSRRDRLVLCLSETCGRSASSAYDPTPQARKRRLELTLPDTPSRSMPERDDSQSIPAPPSTLLVSLKPPLRPELPRILPPELLGPVDGPRIRPHVRALGDSPAEQGRVARGDASDGWDGWVDAKHFLGYGVEVRELIEHFGSHGSAGRRGGKVSADFFPETLLDV